MKTIMQIYMDWSKKTFVEATAQSSLSKLLEEVLELKFELEMEGDLLGRPKERQLEEYVDCMMCLLHSAAAKGLDMESISKAFYDKLMINMRRKWQLNADKTYSHVKSTE